MSDEEGNYDEFMMSEDGELDSIEMEEESGEENGVVGDDDGVGSVEESEHGVLQGPRLPGTDELSAGVQGLYETGKSFKEDQEFVAARQALRGVQDAVNAGAGANGSTTGAGATWWFRAQKQLVKSWLLEATYEGATPARRAGLLEELRALRVWLPGAALQRERATGSVLRLLERLVPGIGECFLFDEPATIARTPGVDMETLRFRLALLAEFEQLAATMQVADAAGSRRLRETLRFKTLETRVWVARCQHVNWRAKGDVDDGETGGVVDNELVAELQRTCAGDFDALALLLQCLLLRFLQGAPVDVDALRGCLAELQTLFSKLFSLSQRPRVLAAVHFGHCIVAMRDESPQGRARRVAECRDGFWECFKSLEEIGIARSLDNARFRDLALTGFVLAEMVVGCQRDAANERITPFELEQIKIVESAPLVQDLKRVYNSFKALDLPRFAASMQRLGHFRTHLGPLFSQVYQLARVQKLWNHVACLYTCISLSDIQQMLQIGDAMAMTRDELLTLLMKSIMNGSAKVYFKLDLTRDLVYFGDEYKNHFSAYTKSHYLARRAAEQELRCASYAPKQRGPRASVSLNQDAAQLRADKEWVDGVGVFDPPARLAGTNAVHFMDELQALREGKQHEDPPAFRRETKLPELLALVTESLG